MVTMKQIANRAGVSISTVSLVLNNRDIGRVSPDVAERVRDIAAELLPALQKAVAMNKPVVIDVYMKNIPTPTAGHWNIMDIYSPGKKVHHVSTDD